MTKRQMTYSRFEGFEEQLAHCYFMLQERFIANPQLSRFWGQTAMEEIEHHSILRYCRQRDLMADIDLEPDTADHIQQLLDTTAGIVRDPDVSVDEAFYAALLMEASELDDIYQSLIDVLAKDHRPLYDSIHARLRSHHASFVEAATKFCSNRGFSEAFHNLERKVL